MPYAYRKSERIRKNSEFASVMKGKRLSADGLSLFYRSNDTGTFRIGISVGKKLANAVRRNRIKRQIRACIMKVLKHSSSGYDLVFVARRELTTAGNPQILKAVETVLHRAPLGIPKSEGTGS